MNSPGHHVDLDHLPNCPGAYLMKDAGGKVVYVGKANNLRSRVRSHFGHPQSDFVPLVERVEYIAAENEGEALLLEYQLIKKYKPRFNIRLRDDKKYPYIKLTLGETYPRAFLTRTLREDGGLYFGPYPNPRAARMVLEAIKEIFPYRSCKYKSSDFPLPRACIEYEMKRCIAPCIGACPSEEYREIIQEVVRFLRGRKEEVRHRMEERMHEASSKMLYEKAATYRDIIQSIETLSERQVVSTPGMMREQAEDYLGLSRYGDVISMVVLKKRSGRVVASEYYFLDAPEGEKDAGDAAVYEAFVLQYYDKISDFPRKIFVPAGITPEPGLEDFVAERAGFKIDIRRAQRGKRRQSLELAAKNASLRAESQFRKTHGVKGKIEPSVEQLQRLLDMSKPPMRIEGYDISNISGTDAVGSMVVLQGGLPHRSGYRRFRISRVEGIDDYAMMQEMLERRINRREDERFGPWPDLIMIDGGRGHLSSVAEVFDRHSITDVKLISLAKEEELIFTLDRPEPVRLPERSPVLKMIQRLRDEAHRFAIDYHRKLRSKRLSRSMLEEIEGLGQKRKKKLLRHFGSVKAIRQASEQDIASVPGIPGNLAHRIAEHFQPGRDIEAEGAVDR